MSIQIENPHWRDSARTPRFFLVDAWAVFPLALWMLHAKYWTFIIAILMIAFFFTIEKFKFTLPVFFRFIRSYLAGPVITAYPWWRE